MICQRLRYKAFQIWHSIRGGSLFIRCDRCNRRRWAEEIFNNYGACDRCWDVYETAHTYTTGVGQVLHRVHCLCECAGRSCVIHNPSDHAMREFPTLWRDDRGIMERICPHGIGHPDPDDLAYKESIGRKECGIHGCDGCCSGNEVSGESWDRRQVRR